MNKEVSGIVFPKIRNISNSEWAFRFTLYYLISQLGAYIITIKQNPFLHDPIDIKKRLMVLSVIGLTTLVSAIITLSLSYGKREPGNTKRIITTCLVGILTLLEVVLRILNTLFV